jgi:pimeloyl-ACP methyl ester carboxylesterase
MTRAILLPGMDGTGELLTEFAAALAPEFDALIVSYPTDVALDYQALIAFVRDLLPSGEQFLLIAESFSGPVAIGLAASKPDGLIGVVMCASFANAPRPRLRPFVRLFQPLPPQRLPARLAMPVLMGRWSSPDWSRRVQRTIRAIAPIVMRRRLNDVSTVDMATLVAHIDSPLLYLKASNDRLVLADSWHAIHQAGRNAACIEIEGPHFLLQAKPQECAVEIKRYFPS